MWSVQWKFKTSEYEVTIQELEQCEYFFPNFKYPLSLLQNLSQGNLVTLPDSGLKYSPFQNLISFLLLPWVFFWLNQAKSKACCLNTPLHCMSESQNSFKRSHLTQKINHDGHCINHALLLFPSTVHDTVRNAGFQALQIGQGDKMNLQKYIRYKHRGCNQIC